MIITHHSLTIIHDHYPSLIRYHLPLLSTTHCHSTSGAIHHLQLSTSSCIINFHPSLVIIYMYHSLVLKMSTIHYHSTPTFTHHHQSPIIIHHHYHPLLCFFIFTHNHFTSLFSIRTITQLNSFFF